MPNSGQVYVLPPARDDEGDSKSRPHVVLRDCEDSANSITLAYASTQPTEAHHGAQNVLVNPAATSYSRSGFRHPTYVYPARLIAIDPDDLGEPEGRVIDEMPPIRMALRKALGLGTGTSVGNGPAAGSWRGRLAVMHEPLAEELGTHFGVILTEPAYSIAERYQIVVPILSGEDFEIGEYDVPVGSETTKWLVQVGGKYAASFLWVDAVFSIFQAREMSSYTKLCLDEETLRNLEQSMERFLQL